jgi:dihydrofolate reductase
LSINLIAAISRINQIGFENDLLCKLPNDLKRFKQLTENHIVVMGYNTYKSLGKSLPNRINVVLTRKKEHDLPSDVFVYDSIESVLHEYNHVANKEIELWVIGGESIYSQFMNHADKLYLTVIDNKFEKADTHFPTFDTNDWTVIDYEHNRADDKNEFDHWFITYERKID